MSRSAPAEKLLQSPASAVMLAASAMSLGTALDVHNGSIDPPAMTAIKWLAAATIFAAVGIATSRVANPGRAGRPGSGKSTGDYPSGNQRIARRLLAIILIGGAAFEAILHVAGPPEFSWVERHVPAAQTLAFKIAMVMSGVLAIFAARGKRGWRIAFLGVLALTAGACVWQIHADPSPTTDTFVVQQEASAALLAGRDPFSMRLTNVYGDDPRFGTAPSGTDGKISGGYPYMPLSLLMDLPGYFLGGDHRYAQIAAMIMAAVLLAASAPPPLGVGAACLLLLSQRTTFVIEESWTEPFAIMLLAFTVWAALKKPKLAPVALGLFLAIKQDMIVAVPLIPLLIPRPWSWRPAGAWLAIAAATALAATAPLALGHVQQFKGAVGSVANLQGLHRTDALSFVTWNYWQTGQWLGDWTAFVGVAVAIVWTWGFAPRNAAGFAAGVGFTHLLLFACSKHAFCNHYYFAVGAFCCAVAAARVSAVAAAATSLDDDAADLDAIRARAAVRHRMAGRRVPGRGGDLAARAVAVLV
jgi:hypothetical protein